MLRQSMLVLCVLLSVVLLHCDGSESESLADKIPTAFYPKLRKICVDPIKFLKCLVKNKALEQPESDAFQVEFEKAKACPFDKDNKVMKEQLRKLAENADLCQRLSNLAKHLGALMKCTR